MENDTIKNEIQAPEDIFKRLGIVSARNLPAPVHHKFLFKGPEDSNFIPEGRLSMIYGPGGTGKSYLALQIAVALADGKQLIETFNPVEKAPVLYVSLEDSQTVIGWRLSKIASKLNPGPDLWTPEDMPDSFFEKIREVLSHKHYKLIIIDPLISIISGLGLSENDNGEMQVLISEIRAISRDFNTAILLVHHTNKESRKEGEQASGTALRGASAIGDGCRFMIGMDRKTKTEKKVKTEKSVKTELPEIYISNTKNNFSKKFNEISVLPDHNGVLTLATGRERINAGDY